MAIDDYLDPEVGVAVAVSAVVFSPPVRRVVRRGAVFGLAGIMMAGDALATLVGGLGRGVRQAPPALAASAAGAMPSVVSSTAPEPGASVPAAPAADDEPTVTASRAQARGGTKAANEGANA